VQFRLKNGLNRFFKTSTLVNMAHGKSFLNKRGTFISSLPRIWCRSHLSSQVAGVQSGVTSFGYRFSVFPLTFFSARLLESSQRKGREKERVDEHNLRLIRFRCRILIEDITIRYD